jgi:hypothetical protein
MECWVPEQISVLSLLKCCGLSLMGEDFTRGHFITSFAESSSVKGLDFIGLLTGVETSGMGYEMTSR